MGPTIRRLVGLGGGASLGLALTLIASTPSLALYPDCPEGCRILMLGSSRTDGIPPKLKNIVESLGYSPVVQARALDGYYLSNHDSDQQTTNKIAQGWDWLVLQERQHVTPNWIAVNSLIDKAQAANPNVKILGGFNRSSQHRNLELLIGGRC